MAGLITNKDSFAINGITFPAQKMHWGYESLASEDSGRTLDGVMHINWVFRKIRKIEITLPPCDAATINRLINLVQGKEYNISFYDPSVGNMVTAYCYTSNSGVDLYSGVIKNGLWQGFEFHAIEIAGTR